MFSWGEQCHRGFRLKDGTYVAEEKDNGVCYLDLGHHISDLSAGLRVLAFVKSNGNAFIIRTSEDKDGSRTRGKQKCVESKEKFRGVSCSDDAVVLLTRKGQVICVDTRGKGNLRPLKCLSGVQVSQISCGSQHSIALTKDGQVFTWGQNSRGQLGLGQGALSLTSPVLVPSLSDLPVVQVAAGGEHSSSVSLSGTVFCWGNNHSGQLGVGDTTDKLCPTVVHNLNKKKACFVSCGLMHTAVLTQDGAVFTFGAGGHGQLGHNSFRDELRPRLIAELLWAKVTQVACGRLHTLVLTESQRIFSFGCGDQGQLGQREESQPAVPLPVCLPPEHNEKVQIGHIFAGANCSFATCLSEDTEVVSNVVIWEKHGSLEDKIHKWISGSEPWKQTKPEILRIFSSMSCLNRSFLEHSKEKHLLTSTHYCGLNLTAAQRSFATLLNKVNVLEQVEAAVLSSLSSLNKAPPGVEALRVYLLLTELLVVLLKHNPPSELAAELADAIQSLSPESRKVLRTWWASLSYSTRRRHVEVWRDALSHILPFNSLFHDARINLVLILEDMYNINTAKTGDEKLPESTFSLRLSDTFLQNDVALWRSTKTNRFFFSKPFVLCNYNFLLDLESKKKVFDMDCKWTQKQHQASQQMYFDLFLGWIPCSEPDYFYLKLKRASLLDDTFQHLAACSEKALKKPLIVLFDGDSKITDVYKRDLFHHLFLEIVSADSEMIVFSESQTLAWFPSSVMSEKRKKQFLIFGMLCGLALYNRSIVHLPFPLALFKKLLGVEPSLDDLTELSPSIGQSLRYILDYEADVLDLDLYFTIDWDKTEVELDPQNPGKPVTNDNRQDFVDAYVEHVFNTSVQSAFEEFRRGFFQVCEQSAVQLFRPEELRGVMVGGENYDWTALKQNTVYEPEYHEGHPSILMFWEVFEELNEEQKKDFLWFLTGYRRAPIFGLGKIQMKVRVKLIHRGSMDEHFPESLTCHSILELPLYSSKGIMRKKLTEAIIPETGFRT